MYSLDTNTCIRYLNGRSPQVRQKLQSILATEIVVCSIVRAELFFGSLKSQQPDKNLAKQRAFLLPYETVEFDDECAYLYPQTRTYLEKQGTPIGANDLLIAAIALANKLILVTPNTRKFSRVPNLNIDDWEI